MLIQVVTIIAVTVDTTFFWTDLISVLLNVFVIRSIKTDEYWSMVIKAGHYFFLNRPDISVGQHCNTLIGNSPSELIYCSVVITGTMIRVQWSLCTCSKSLLFKPTNQMSQRQPFLLWLLCDKNTRKFNTRSHSNTRGWLALEVDSVPDGTCWNGYWYIPCR